MSWTAALALALRALWCNKTRAMLTTLGVIIGVASVIAMVAIGAGAQQRIAQQLENMGTNSLVIRSGSVTRGGVGTGAGTTERLTLADAVAIAELPIVEMVAPSVQAPAQVRYRGANWGTAIHGVTPEYFAVRSGVLTGKGGTAWGTDQDDAIFAPLTTVQRKLRGITHIERIELTTTWREAAFRATKDLTKLLREHHQLGEDADDDFRIYNRAELAQTSEESARVFTWLLGSIASVSLLVEQFVQDLRSKRLRYTQQF